MKERAKKLLTDVVLGQYVDSVEGGTLNLKNGTELILFESAQDCCARAFGSWEAQGDFQGIITDVEFEDCDVDEEWGTSEARGYITLLHNGNPVVQGECYADNGNGGYYFSVLSLRVACECGSFQNEEILSC